MLQNFHKMTSQFNLIRKLKSDCVLLGEFDSFLFSFPRDRQTECILFSHFAQSLYHKKKNVWKNTILFIIWLIYPILYYLFFSITLNWKHILLDNFPNFMGYWFFRLCAPFSIIILIYIILLYITICWLYSTEYSVLALCNLI